MMEKSSKSLIRIELTAEQKEQVRQITGKQVPAVRLNVEALEGRLAPALAPN